MKIDRDTIHKLAGLVRIKIRREEEDSMMSDLNSILKMMDKLNEVDTSEVAAFTHFSYQTDHLRDDLSEKFNIKEDVLSRSPVSDENFFIVPKVIKNDE
ncbi:MAG: Asp-tRNA(Asn)/Glu-tRNA(Gln) amidotransferase subunit GatC [Chitinophagales bacterium]|nr:Asp-tRNA(Asn)/Glu-tRNA(Gln) amidotransferase subunit GatC [Chitinophagales bacterium]